MGYSAMTFNLQFSSFAVALVCVLLFHISLASASSLRRNKVPAFDHLSKRDVFMGLAMQCQTSPKNCPGGYKRSGLAGKLLDTEPLLRLDEDDDEQTRTAIQAAEEDFRRNVNELRTALRYRLLDALRSSSSESSEENRDGW